MISLRKWLVIPVLLTLITAAVVPAAAESIADPSFQKTWAYTDQPVVSGQAHRTWMWGPTANTPALWEPYFESPGGQREVQYFDKTRMEITHPDGDQSSIWYVTNGLLAKELITGQMQVGDGSFVQHDPAQVNVAGDSNDPNGPTYETFSQLTGSAAISNNTTIIQTVDREANVGSDQGFSSYNVVAKDVGSPTQHTVASVFWDFMNSSGVVYDQGNYLTAPLFANPFYATGYPLTEAYWTTVLVGGVQKQVLVQVFERRVLTYTPSNPEGWKVEAGNVGQHYYTWRYSQLGESPVSASSSKPVTNLSVPNFDHVYVIMMENKEISSVVGSPDAPYINSLSQQYGLATDYTGISHPSEPNYLALWSGSTNGVGDDNVHDLNGTTVADQLEAAGKSWMVYAENYPVSQAGDTCYTDASAHDGEDGTGNYVRRHNPAMSFTSLSGNVQRCAQHVTDFTHFNASTADFSFIVPNLCHDMHDCPVATGDGWLQSWLESNILGTDTWAQTNSAIIITWDEGSTNIGGGGVIPTIVISNHTPKSFVSPSPANHYSLLRTIQEAFGLDCLNESCNAKDLSQFFTGTN
ncbi:MAG: alkaline phosphatase family protein [Nitrolancea sp.]